MLSYKVETDNSNCNVTFILYIPTGILNTAK